MRSSSSDYSFAMHRFFFTYDEDVWNRNQMLDFKNEISNNRCYYLKLVMSHASDVIDDDNDRLCDCHVVS